MQRIPFCLSIVDESLQVSDSLLDRKVVEKLIIGTKEAGPITDLLNLSFHKVLHRIECVKTLF